MCKNVPKIGEGFKDKFIRAESQRDTLQKKLDAVEKLNKVYRNELGKLLNDCKKANEENFSLKAQLEHARICIEQAIKYVEDVIPEADDKTDKIERNLYIQDWRKTLNNMKKPPACPACAAKDRQIEVVRELCSPIIEKLESYWCGSIAKKLSEALASLPTSDAGWRQIKFGTRVYVDCKQYKGEGVAEQEAIIPVRLGNGNICHYPCESVRPLPQPPSVNEKGVDHE